MRLPSAVLVASVVLFGCQRKDVATADDAGAAPVAATPAPAPPPPTPYDRIKGQQTLAGALLGAEPMMSDQRNGTSDGTAALTLWSIKNMHWADISPAKDETSFARVQKDSDAERGKRLCVSGHVIQIATEKVDGFGRLYKGLLMASNGNIFNYFAAGSSGDLVERSNARFCGVVAERYDYSNSGGGTGHAVTVVGMFDLPENRQVAANMRAGG